MDATSAQIKLATKLHKHKVANATKNPLKPVADLPLSSEMIDLLEQTLATDEEGYLPETVGSHLSMPLSAISVYCPTAAILQSKQTAARIPSPVGKLSRSSRSPFTPSTPIPNLLVAGTGETDNNTSPTTRNDSFRAELELEPGTPLSPANFSGTMTNTQLSGKSTPFGSPASESKPPINEAKSRLDVLWLRRKAELALEDGDLRGSFNFLQEALDEHLGGRDYSNARLSQPVISSDPAELLNTIRNDYFLYDTYAHKMAGVVQRWYHRTHAKRCNAITNITRVFRGFQHRRRFKKYQEMRRQCAVLIQRRFRKHLIRMHALATLIKRWYKLRRIVKEFQKRLRIFRMARRIQALYRGHLGRQRAALRRRQLLLVIRIQRTARAYITRRDRAYVLSLFHQRYWRAARVIQTTIRRIQAIERCQIKLLLELSRENIRARKEKIVVEEALRMQKIRNSYYFRTEAGRIHLGLVQRQAVVKKLNIKYMAPQLTADQQNAAKLLHILELYDADGTGNIPTKRLKKVLHRALVTITTEQLAALKHQLDPEETGQIAFTDFIDWYNSPGADDIVEPESILANLSMVRLQFKRQVQRLDLSHRFGAARKLLNSQHASWLTKDTASTFRLTHAPKYQCCQCREAFVMFTDYYAHFDAESGNCGVTGEKAMFFPRYWLRDDWARQRTIEREVIRCNDEQPYVAFQCRLASCADLVYQRHSAVAAATQVLIDNASDLAHRDLQDVKKAALKKITSERIRSLFDELECVSVPDVAAERITKAMCLPFSKQWITDELAQANDVAKWLNKYLPDYTESDHSSFSDNSSSVKMSDFFKSEDPKTSRHHVQFSLESKRLPTISDSGLRRRRARDLGSAQVRFLRAVHVHTQAALFAMIEFRARKPRMMTLSDTELQELGLISLTNEHYITLELELVARLRRINAMYVRLHSHVPTPTCPGLRRLLFSKYTPVAPAGDITGDSLYQLYIDFAHLVALAKSRCVARSDVGAMVQRRLATDLKISKHRLLLTLVDDPTIAGKSNKNNNLGISKSVRYENATSRKIIADAALDGEERADAVYALELQFLYGKYCSIFKDEGIDLADLDLVAQEFALNIPEADKHVISAQLDPEMTGFIHFAHFLRWMRSPTPGEFASLSLRTRQTVQRMLQAATRTKYFAHAGDVMHARQRAVSRMEVAVREGILYEDDFSWEKIHHSLLSFYRSCDGGQVAEAVNARKYHISAPSSSAKAGSVDRYGFDDDSQEQFGEFVSELNAGRSIVPRASVGWETDRSSRQTVKHGDQTTSIEPRDSAGWDTDNSHSRGDWGSHPRNSADRDPSVKSKETELASGGSLQPRTSAESGVAEGSGKAEQRKSSQIQARNSREGDGVAGQAPSEQQGPQIQARNSAGTQGSGSGLTTPSRQSSRPTSARPISAGIASTSLAPPVLERANEGSGAELGATEGATEGGGDTVGDKPLTIVTSAAPSPVPSRPTSARPSSAGVSGPSPQISPVRRPTSRPSSYRRRTKRGSIEARISVESDPDTPSAPSVPLTPSERAAEAADAITASIQAAQRFSALPGEAEAGGSFGEGTNDQIGDKDVAKPTIHGRVYDNLVKLYTLKWREEESEHRVIYRVVEQRAESQFWVGLLSSLGRYNLFTERMLMKQLDAVIDAVGYCLPEPVKDPKQQGKYALEGFQQQPTMQDVLTAHFGSSVSSLASGSLHNLNTVDTFTMSVKAARRSPNHSHSQYPPSPQSPSYAGSQTSWHIGRYNGGLGTNGSVSSHTNSFRLVEGQEGEDYDLDDEDLPFKHLAPGEGGSISPGNGSLSQRALLLPTGAGAGVGETGLSRKGATSVRFQGVLQEDAAGDEDTDLQRQQIEEQYRLQQRRNAADANRLLLSALETAISVYDTDCTGDLDEGEVRLLLHCLRCGLSEKAFRHCFADHDDTVRGVSVRALVVHLADRVRYSRGNQFHTVLFRKGLSLVQVGHLRRALGVLVTLQRQIAHKRALQTVKMSKMGRIVMLRESHTGTSDHTLLVRTQLFAMRQVQAFLRTTQGRIKRYHTSQDVRYSWQVEVMNPVLAGSPVATSGVCYLNYAYSVHHDGEGLLVTELPHVVKFLIRECRLQPSAQLAGLGQVFCDLRGAADVRALSHSEFSSLLTPLFHPPAQLESNTFLARLARSRRLRAHAKLRMLSCARQQAVKIAMDFPVIDVAETNYRCSVLGLRRFIDANLSTLTAATKQTLSLPAPAVAIEESGSVAILAGGLDPETEGSPVADDDQAPLADQNNNEANLPDTADDTVESQPPAVTDKPKSQRPFPLFSFLKPARDPEQVKSESKEPVVYVPMEAVSLYLLAQGYSFRDLSHDSLREIVDVDHLQGHFRLDAVSVAAAKATARDSIAKTCSYVDMFHRKKRKLLHGAQYNAEFKVTVLALMQYDAIVDKKGGEFLKELLVGVSHCLE